MEATEKILIVDDEQAILDLLHEFLGKEGFQVSTANNGETAMAALANETYSLVISDLKMPEMNGLELLHKIRKLDPAVVTVIMTGFGTLETAITAMKEGAHDYILKPFKIDQVVSVIQRGLESRRLREENLRLRETLSLYNMSEAINQTLQMDVIIDLTLETTYTAIEADFVNYLRKEAKETQLHEVGRRSAVQNAPDFLASDAHTNRLLARHAEKIPVVFDREQCAEFFGREICSKLKMSSFLSVPIYLQGRIEGIINAVNFTGKGRFTEGQRKAVALIANRTASSIENARLFANLEDTLHQTIAGLAKAIEAKDNYTHGHSERVRQYAMLIATTMGLSEEDIEVIGKAALLHDIGKIGVDLTYINKPGALTSEQVYKFRTHPEIGKEILTPIRSLAAIIPAVYHHHEKYNGKGYPHQLKGEEIPLGARILAIADSYDAMTSHRAYRQAMKYEAAIAELRQGAGKQFDPKIVELFIGELDKRIQQGKPPFLTAADKVNTPAERKRSA